MPPYLITVAKGVATYLALTMLLGSIHSTMFDLLPEEGVIGSVSTTALLFFAFVPALASGYLFGRLAKVQGIAGGALSIALGAILLSSVFSGGGSDISQYLVFILIGALAGGCGELHANKKAA